MQKKNMLEEALQEEFYRCCAQGDIENLTLLLNDQLEKIDINKLHEEDYCGGLTYACMNNHMDIVDYLLHSDKTSSIVNFNTISNCITQCCIYKEMESLCYILDNTTILNDTDKENLDWLMLKLAMLNADNELIYYLFTERKIAMPVEYKKFCQENPQAVRKETIKFVNDLVDKINMHDKLEVTLKRILTEEAKYKI